MKGIKRLPVPFRSRQSGASAVEFAFVFPILLAVFYGGVVYTYVFVLQQALTFSAQKGAEAALAVVPNTDATTTSAARLAQANSASHSALSWLPGDQYSRVSTGIPQSGTCGGAVAPPAGSFVYQVSFNLAGGVGVAPLFPTLVALPLVGTIPPLPTTLVACAVA